MADPLPQHLSQIFEAADFTHIVNSADEVGAVLRGQQMAEEWLTYWIEQKLACGALLEGVRLDFPQRLMIAQRLQFPETLGRAYAKVNEIRNRLAHRKGYRLQSSELDSLALLIEGVPSQRSYSPVAQLRIRISGLDASGQRSEIEQSYAESDSIRKFTLLIAMLSTKTYEWMQREGVSAEPNSPATL